MWIIYRHFLYVDYYNHPTTNIFLNYVYVINYTIKYIKLECRGILQNINLKCIIYKYYNNLMNICEK